MMERGYQLRNALDSLVQAEVTEWNNYVARRTQNGTKPMPKKSRTKPAIVDDKMSVEDWSVITEYLAILKPLKIATKRLEGRPKEGKFGAIWEVLLTMEWLLKHLEEFKVQHELDEEPHLRIGCNLGWMKLDRYYTLTEDSPVYLAALILHPAFRWSTVESQWGDHPDWLVRGKAAVQELWEEYRNLPVEQETIPEQPTVPRKTTDLDDFMASIRKLSTRPARLPSATRDDLGNIEALNNNYYKQFPVALFVVTTFTSNAFTLTKDMQQSMEQSFKFIKFSQANPTSQLATDFRTALGNKSSQEDAVNKFFKGTGSFKLCTLSTWTAVFGWQTQFTSPWQGTYYLYSLGSSTAGSSSAPALVATLVITSSADANSAVLTMANTDNENTEVVMAGNGTIQEKDPGVGNISLALAPAWLNVSQASQQDGKTVYKYVIGAAFTGTINGINVAGNLNQLSIPDPSDSSQNASDKNSANKLSIGSIASIVGMLTGTLGVAASIGMVYFMWKSHKQAEDQKKLDVLEGARNKADANTRERQVDDIFQRDELPKVKTKAGKLEADVLPKVDDGYLVLSQAETTQSVVKKVETLELNLVRALTNGPPNKTIEEVGDIVENVKDKLRDATNIEKTPRERKAVLDNLKVDVKDADGKLQTVLKDEVDLLPQEVVKSLEIAQDAAQKVEQQSEAKGKAEEDLREQNKQEPNKEVDDGNFGNVEEQDDAKGGKTDGGKVGE
ncbi:hypothetical protein FOBRF1_013658 [Fusarium oxysporum]